MAINIRSKGQNGEREICDWLNGVAYRALQAQGLKYPPKPIFQRNQNQSAVGGSDITNPFNLCIEVKRQETLSIEAWWLQCVKASQGFGGRPVVIFRQNGKRKWRVLMEGNIIYHDNTVTFPLRCEITHEDFERVVYNWVLKTIIDGKWFPEGNNDR